MESVQSVVNSSKCRCSVNWLFLDGGLLVGQGSRAQEQSKGRADARFALDVNRAAHDAAEAVADREAQSRAAIFPGRRAVGLLEHADGSPANAVYFWATGLLSSFLDNAPTYLVFFELASGEAAKLMGPLGHALAAISLGAVFMGANTYIGNAPNFMVYAIARNAGVKMPGFFPYMLWSGAILLPLFAAITYFFF